MAKVLIVDDEPGMRQVISKVLSPYFDIVVQAEDGKTALELAQSEAPDLVMLDIRLPDMDGLDILANIKTIKPNTPVIMLSGFGDVETAVELVRRGAFDYISKPFKVDRLLDLVKSALAESGVKPKKDIGPAVPAEIPEIKEPDKDVPRPKSQPVVVPDSVIEIKNKWIFLGIGLFVAIVGGMFAYKHFTSGPAKKEYTVTYANPSSIFADKKNIWVNDWMEEVIYKHKIDSKMSLESSFKLTGMQLNGLAFDGKNLWTCSSTARKIYKHNMDAALSIAGTYESPGLSVASLYFDGQSLWSMDYQQGKIYKHDMNNNMVVLKTYESFAANPCGMFKKGNSFYVGDSSTNMLYKVKAQDFSIESVYIIPGYENKSVHLSGIAYDGEYIYTCADGVSKILRHTFSSLKPLGR